MNKPDKKSIDRTIRNIATPEEARSVIRWFSTPEGSRYLSSLMDEDINKTTLGMETELIDHAVPTWDMYGHIMNRIRWQKRRRILFRAAAILIPAMLFIGQFLYVNSRIDIFDNAGFEEIVVPKGERLQVVFQDGSKATLNSESRMRYPRKFAFAERRVEMEGEAFFEIATNKKRPFKVDLNGLEVEVTGTAFNTKSYPEDRDVFVSLETGTVSLDAQSKTIAHLNPGEQAIYNKNTGICKIIKQDNVGQNSAWKNNRIIFEHTPLTEVIKILGRYYNTEFVIKNHEALSYSFTITTTRKQIHEVLAELEKITPIVFYEKEGQIWVDIKK